MNEMAWAEPACKWEQCLDLLLEILHFIDWKRGAGTEFGEKSGNVLCDTMEIHETKKKKKRKWKKKPHTNFGFFCFVFCFLSLGMIMNACGVGLVHQAKWEEEEVLL